MLTEITDVTRLKVGDIMVWPSESGSKRKRLHLKPSSYGSYGVSIGFTGRSENTAKGVEKLLTADDGKSRVMYVSNVHERYHYRDVERKYGSMIGGGREVRDSSDPEIRTASFKMMPTPDSTDTLAFRFWAKSFRDDTAAALRGSLVGRHLLDRYANQDRDFRGWAIRDAYESSATSDARQPSRTYLNCTVPHGCVARQDDELPVPDIADEFLGNEMFATVPYHTEKEHTVCVGPKFLLMAKRNGARFYRPDAEFRASVARMTAAVLVNMYAERQTCVLNAASAFVKRLVRDVEDVKWRGKSALGIVRKLRLRKAEERNTFKELK